MLRREDESSDLTTFLVVVTQSVVDPELESAARAAFERGAVEEWIIGEDELTTEARAQKISWFHEEAECDLLRVLHGTIESVERQERLSQDAQEVSTERPDDDEEEREPVIMRPAPAPVAQGKSRLKKVIPSRKRSGKKKKNKSRKRRR